MNSITPPLLMKIPNNTSAWDNQEREITAVVHQLKDQACTLSLGISALQYPGESESERQHYLAVLEAVVGDMSREFQRLDQWLIEVGYKPKRRDDLSVARRRRIKRGRFALRQR
ncbi:MAG: hypothetical protein ACREQV_18215 [Candidatus Binatia bacterium]